MEQKVMMIFNPRADRGNAWQIPGHLHQLVAGRRNIDWNGTVYPGHAVELARRAGEQGYQRVIALGGDGTVHEVINGLMGVSRRKRPALGIVPLGSGNDFAQSIGIPQKPENALRVALGSKMKDMDLGLVTDGKGRQEYFNNTLGIGFDAVVNIRTRKIPFLRGFIMYLVAVIQTIMLNFDPLQLRVKTETETWDMSTLMLTACNGQREGGGFRVAPEARTDDGTLDYATVCRVSRLMMLRLVPEVMNGTHGKFKQVRMGRFKKMSLTSDRPLHIHADGEVFTDLGTNIRRLTIEIIPKAVRILTV